MEIIKAKKIALHLHPDGTVDIATEKGMIATGCKIVSNVDEIIPEDSIDEDAKVETTDTGIDYEIWQI